jgi:Meiotically up-regulated gene 113
MPTKKYSAHPFSEAEGYIYVMESAGYYKIGWAKTNPRLRRMAVQCGNPLPVELVGVIEGTRMQESEWHDFFKANGKHVRGEWFDLTELEVAGVLHENIGVDNLPAYDDIA